MRKMELILAPLFPLSLQLPRLFRLAVFALLLLDWKECRLSLLNALAPEPAPRFATPL